MVVGTSLRAWSDGQRLDHTVEVAQVWPGLVASGSVEAIIVVTRAGTLRRLYARATQDPTAGSYVFTVRVDGAATAIVATISPGSTEAQDLAHSKRVKAGAKVEIGFASTSQVDPETTRAELEFA